MRFIQHVWQNQGLSPRLGRTSKSVLSLAHCVPRAGGTFQLCNLGTTGTLGPLTTSCHFPLHRAPGDPWAALCSCEFGYGISIREGRRGELEVKKERKGGSAEQNGGVRGSMSEMQIYPRIPQSEPIHCVVQPWWPWKLLFLFTHGHLACAPSRLLDSHF